MLYKTKLNDLVQNPVLNGRSRANSYDALKLSSQGGGAGPAGWGHAEEGLRLQGIPHRRLPQVGQVCPSNMSLAICL